MRVCNIGWHLLHETIDAKAVSSLGLGRRMISRKGAWVLETFRRQKSLIVKEKNTLNK